MAKLNSQFELLGDAIITNKSTEIWISEDGGLRSSVSIQGFTLEKSLFGIGFSELESISNAKYSYLQKGKEKHIIQKKMVVNDISTGSFFSGHKAYMWQNEIGKFVLSYEMSLQDRFFFPTLDFYSIDNLNRTKFEIHVPSGLEIVIDSSSHLISEGLISMEITNNADEKIYCYESNFLADSIDFETVDSRLRIIIIDSNTGENKETQFANWYRELIQPHQNLTNETIVEISEGRVPKDFIDELDFVEHIFDNVRHKVRYLDVENNIGAIQPRDPNVICNKKQGDCKDMANLLTETLKHFGFESCVGISATRSHGFVNDFPCLSSANHLVCMLKHDGEWIILDATDQFSPFKWPSIHTIGTRVFAVNHEGWEYIDIECKEEMTSGITLSLQFEGNNNIAAAQWEFSGYDRWAIDYVNATFKTADREKYLHQILQLDNSTCKPKNIVWDSENATIIATGQIEFPTMKHKLVGKRVYLKLNFLPIPEDLNLTIPEEGFAYPTTFELTTFFEGLNIASDGLEDHFSECENGLEAQYTKSENGFTLQQIYSVQSSASEQIEQNSFCLEEFTKLYTRFTLKYEN